MTAPRASTSSMLPLVTANVYWRKLSTLPTTQARFAVDLGLIAFYVIVCLLADVCGHPVSNATQLTLGTFLLTLSGVNTTQFIMKRKTEDPAVIAAHAATAPAADGS